MLSTIHIFAQVYLRAPQLWPLSILAGAVVLVGVVWLYPAQLGQIGWPWRGVLPLLRLASMFVLAISFVKPVALRVASADERGSVIVLVDRSKSMSVIDNSRSTSQLVALADSLGKLPQKVRSDSPTMLDAGLERLRTAAGDVRGAQEDLDYARVSGRDIQLRKSRLTEVAAHYAQIADELSARAQVLPNADDLKQKLSEVAHPPSLDSRDGWRGKALDKIRDAIDAVRNYQRNADDDLYQSNPEVRKASDEVAALSRYALVEQALLRPGGIVANMQKEASVAAFGLASDITPLELTKGDKLANSLGSSPTGDGSDLTAGIARTVSGRSVRAVVVLSDGRQVGGDPTIVSGLTPNGVPVFTVSAAAPDPPRDLSFSSVQMPSSVLVGQTINVKATLRHAQFDGATVDLHCKIGDEPEQSRKIPIHGGEPAQWTFSAKLAKPGVQRIQLWFPPLKGEASTENNHAERWVKVVPDLLKVMVIAGWPTRDFQYLRGVLRSREIDLKDILVDPNNPGLNLGTREILSQDVIILIDVPIAALDQRRWDAVERVAQLNGGSVILVAGESHLPSEYNKLPTAALLPFRADFKPAWLVWPGSDPSFHFVPTSDPEAQDLLKLPGQSQNSVDAESVPRRWEQLPGCGKFLQLPEVRDKNWKPQAQALLVEEESRLPVLTEMHLGAGRAFFLALNETWRWRFKVGPRDQEHFWRQLVQHASEPPYFAHDGPLAFDTDKVSAGPGETIHVRARITDETADPQSSYVLQVLVGGHSIMEQPMTAVGQAGGGRYAANLSLGGGDYQIRWTANVGSKNYSVSMPVHVGATSEAELSDLSGDSNVLHKLAEASGGEFMTLEQANRLPERIAAVGDARSRFAEMSLWDSKYLFILVVGCFGVEWGLRKRLGLA